MVTPTSMIFNTTSMLVNDIVKVLALINKVW